MTPRLPYSFRKPEEKSCGELLRCLRGECLAAPEPLLKDD